MTFSPTLSGQGQCQGPILGQGGLSWTFQPSYGPFLRSLSFGTPTRIRVPNAARQSREVVRLLRLLGCLVAFGTRFSGHEPKQSDLRKGP